MNYNESDHPRSRNGEYRNKAGGRLPKPAAAKDGYPTEQEMQDEVRHLGRRCIELEEAAFKNREIDADTEVLNYTGYGDYVPMSRISQHDADKIIVAAGSDRSPEEIARAWNNPDLLAEFSDEVAEKNDSGEFPGIEDFDTPDYENEQCSYPFSQWMNDRYPNMNDFTRINIGEGVNEALAHHPDINIRRDGLSIRLASMSDPSRYATVRKQASNRLVVCDEKGGLISQAQLPWDKDDTIPSDNRYSSELKKMAQDLCGIGIEHVEQEQ
jgi:hypothetical protein